MYERGSQHGQLHRSLILGLTRIVDAAILRSADLKVIPPQNSPCRRILKLRLAKIKLWSGAVREITSYINNPTHFEPSARAMRWISSISFWLYYESCDSKWLSELSQESVEKWIHISNCIPWIVEDRCRCVLIHCHTRWESLLLLYIYMSLWTERIRRPLLPRVIGNSLVELQS